MGWHTVCATVGVSRAIAQTTAASALRHVSDRHAGITRHPTAQGFRYEDDAGRPITDRDALTRIAALAVPPAWTEVWICADGRGHLQATGRDARGRKQYRYHAAWRAHREADKFAGLARFGAALPRIRAHTARDLARPGLSDRKVLAAAVRLLDLTLMRIGNVEYARLNGSFGLTTLRNRHVRVTGQRLVFRFRGKAGREHALEVIDRRLARIVARCRDLPGQELFQYVDADGASRPIDSGAVNAYLSEIARSDCTAKSFRTWGGTLLAARLFALQAREEHAQGARPALRPVLDSVARALGNTPAICRKSYIHPAVIEAYLAGTLPDTLAVASDAARGDAERALLAFLRARRARRSAPGKPGR